MTNIRKIISKCMLVGIVACIMSASYVTVLAANSTYSIYGDSYENNGEDNFANGSKKDILLYGKNALGSMTIVGEIEEKGLYENVMAFNINDNVSFEYRYDGMFNDNDKDQWNIESSDSKKIHDIELDENVQEGVIIVQKSSDGINWINATDPVYDAFEEANDKKSVLYTTNEDEMLTGTYFRVVVAYQMCKLTNIIEQPWYKPDIEEYDHICCVEEYKYYICTNRNYVSVYDIEGLKNVPNNTNVLKGFSIHKNGSNDKVEVSRNGEKAYIANDFDLFIEPGDYLISITTKLNKRYCYKITISEGLSSSILEPKVYEFEKDTGFTNGKLLNEKKSNEVETYTSLKVCQKAGFTTTESKHNGLNAYGINGDSVCLLLKLNYKYREDGRDWEIVQNAWGKKEDEKVKDVYVGAIGRGTVIVQTSADGKNWNVEDKGRYTNGLYTTDYATYYSAGDDVVIYTPNGEDVLSGIFIRVIFAYQAKNGEGTSDYLEEYKFYLCSNELSAVTFHNKTIKSIDPYVGEDNENVEVYKKAETLINNSCTVTGFSIDNSLNPTATYSIKRNGNVINEPADKVNKDTGKYDITLSSAVGDKQSVVLYVDTDSNAKAKERYFGESFIVGKRIYGESDYPIYEGGVGLTSYNLEKVDEQYMPIYGEIVNLTTGKIVKLDSSRKQRKGDIVEPGDYEAVFKTGFGSDEDLAGDVREFRFHFSIIENGTAPGPVLNQQRLTDYARTNISDCYPLYYGVTYNSARKGFITVAFANRDDAVKFAYAYEKGMVEVQEDGTFRYNNSTVDGQKVDFESGFELTDAINEASVNNVKQYYFNLSDPFTYTTLRGNVTKNIDDLRSMKLENSAVVFGDGQKDALIDMTIVDDALPVISVKPYSYIEPGVGKTLEKGSNDFVFKKDKYGCDSYKILISDKYGKSYDVVYDRGVGEQLAENNCPSGKVVITESTIYGQNTTYEAIYISPNDNTSTLAINYYEGGSTNTKLIDINDDGLRINADVFSIESLEDALDPFSLVIIRHNDKETFYSADQVMKNAWSEAGIYEVLVKNRLGYGYKITVDVKESDYSSISFAGDGTEKLKDIITLFGAQNVKLPQLERVGYKFCGYKDENGNIYTNDIEEIMFKENLKLFAIWEPVKVKVTIKDFDGSILVSRDVDYGAIIELPILDNIDGYEFQGWKYDDVVVIGNAVKIELENDVEITPSFVSYLSQDEVAVEEGSKSEFAKSTCLMWIVIVVFVVAGVSTWIFYKKKKTEDEIGKEK